MTKILAILYDGGKHAQEQPKLLGTTENALGLKDWAKEKGFEFIVTSDKEGPDSEFQKHIVDADILITTPFHPGYLTKELIEKAKNLKLAVTAGVGSDHIDLNAANTKKITVAEVTDKLFHSISNVVSVAEHVIMTILLLVRNYNVGHTQVVNKEWDVAGIAKNAYDLEGKVVGTLGCGRIGYRVLERLLPFDCKELLYYDYQNLPAEAEKKVNARRVEDLKEFLGQCDIVTINAPLHEGTKGLIDKEKLSWMKKGAWLVNTARGAICVAEDVAEALNSGQLAGAGGDVWNVQPAPKDHCWRSMKHPSGDGNGYVPHYSGTTLDAQIRYANGTKKIIENFLEGKEQNPADMIVENGEYATKAYGVRVQPNLN